MLSLIKSDISYGRKKVNGKIIRIISIKNLEDNILNYSIWLKKNNMEDRLDNYDEFLQVK